MKRTPIALLICLLCFSAYAGGVAVDDTCVLYMDFNDNFGTTYLDQSQYSNHGTRYQATQANGIEQLGLCYNGTDDSIDCGSDPSIKGITNSMTLEMWSKGESDVANGGSLIGTMGLASNRGFMLGPTDDGRCTFSIAIDSNTVASLTVSSVNDPTVWIHWTAVYDSSAQTMRLYKNGTEVGLKDSGVPSSQYTGGSFPVRIGRRGDIAAQFLGLIDEVRIYNRALSVQEIKDSYDRLSG